MEVCMLDLDGTLVDQDYRLTASVNEVAVAVREYQEKGGFVGFHSDTPIDTLCSWSKCLGMNGPLIAENGAIVDWPAMAIDHEPTGLWPKLNVDVIAQALRDSFPDAYSVVGDVNELSRQPIESYTTASSAILINGLRETSLSLFVRGKDQTLASRVAKVLEEARHPELELVFDPEYGFFALRPRAANKTHGVRFLSSRIKTATFVMVGNTVRDFIESPPQVLQIAVANATPEYKRRCSVVTSLALSQGCIEALYGLSEGRY